MYYGYNPNLDSPVFTYQPAINPGQTINYDFQFRDTDVMPASKYAPLNSIFVVNSTTNPLILQVKDAIFPIGPNGVLSLDPSDVSGGFFGFSIKNNGTTAITAGEVYITIQRKGVRDAGDIIQTLIKKFAKE